MTEKQRQRLFALLFLLFFIIAYKCSGQIERVHRYAADQSITTIIPTRPMYFNGGNNDSIVVSVSVDSLEDYYDIRMFMFFPQSRDIQGYSVEIGLTNGQSLDLYSDIVIPKYNYAEYPLDSLAVENLKSSKFDYIVFKKDNILEPCVNIKTKDFFTYFLSNYKK